MKKMIILLIALLSVGSVSAICYDFQIDNMRTCIGSSLFDDIYWNFCVNSDLNLDGVVNLVDVRLLSSQCYSKQTDTLIWLNRLAYFDKINNTDSVATQITNAKPRNFNIKDSK